MDSPGVIVLSGGFSKRMGQEKGLVHFKGKPMIEHTLEKAAEISNDIIIIANVSGYEDFGYPVYTDILKEKGPIGGIHAGLTYSKASYNLVLACDMPLMTTSFLKHLISGTSEEYQIMVPRHDNCLEPLCAVYGKDCLNGIENAANSSDLSLHHFIEGSVTKIIDVNSSLPYYSPYLFSNANNAEELKALELLET